MCIHKWIQPLYTIAFLNKSEPEQEQSIQLQNRMKTEVEESESEPIPTTYRQNVL